MGGCLSVKNKICGPRAYEANSIDQYKPLFALKRDLLHKLGMNDDHFYSIFITYRFKESIRANPEFLKCMMAFRQIQSNEKGDG